MKHYSKQLTVEQCRGLVESGFITRRREDVAPYLALNVDERPRKQGALAAAAQCYFTLSRELNPMEKKRLHQTAHDLNGFLNGIEKVAALNSDDQFESVWPATYRELTLENFSRFAHDFYIARDKRLGEASADVNVLIDIYPKDRPTIEDVIAHASTVQDTLQRAGVTYRPSAKLGRPSTLLD